MQQLVQWCGPGFDGLIIFDEVLGFFKWKSFLLSIDISAVEF